MARAAWWIHALGSGATATTTGMAAPGRSGPVRTDPVAAGQVLGVRGGDLSDEFQQGQDLPVGQRIHHVAATFSVGPHRHCNPHAR